MFAGNCGEWTKWEELDTPGYNDFEKFSFDEFGPWTSKEYDVGDKVKSFPLMGEMCFFCCLQNIFFCINPECTVGI